MVKRHKKRIGKYNTLLPIQYMSNTTMSEALGPSSKTIIKRLNIISTNMYFLTRFSVDPKGSVNVLARSMLSSSSEQLTKEARKIVNY
jgi:hypothetical protein